MPSEIPERHRSPSRCAFPSPTRTPTSTCSPAPSRKASPRPPRSGATTVVQVGCDLKGSRWAAETAAAYEAVHATVALHPNEAPRIVHGDPDGWSRQGARQPGGDGALDEALAEIDRLAALPQVKGVGETLSTTSVRAPKARPPRSAPSAPI